MRARRPPQYQATRGQAMVEFAFMFPLTMLLIVATITGAFLVFQNEAVTNATRAASRWATIETSLYQSSSGSPHCESGTPDTIVHQVQNAANVVQVNNIQLCATKVGGVESTTQLSQANPVANRAAITVDASPTLSAPECVTVTVKYTPPRIPGPWGNILMTVKSSAPTNAAKSTTVCP